MIEVHLIPDLGEPSDAFRGGLHPHSLGKTGEKVLRAVRIIVQEKNAVAGARLPEL
jgi:hypothetical protein